MDDRPRKDRLIQTRVPQDLESTLKDEARKRRLSVSHLIRNVLEDTFSLVDNVVSEVDRVVHDSVGVAQTLKRDAQRLAATARGETAHRERVRVAVQDDGLEQAEPAREAEEPASEANASVDPEHVTVDSDESASGPVADQPAARLPGGPSLGAGALADVYGFQELVLNRAANCAKCGCLIPRGARAFLGMTDKLTAARVWVCQDCLETIAE